MPWLSSDAGRSQCYLSCYVDLIGDLFYQAPEECNFLPDLMSLYFSLPVSNDIYTISREPLGTFTESYDSAMASIQGLIAKAKDFIKSRIRLEGSFANMRV